MEDASDAIHAIHGYEFFGTKLTCELAKDAVSLTTADKEKDNEPEYRNEFEKRMDPRNGDYNLRDRNRFACVDSKRPDDDRRQRSPYAYRRHRASLERDEQSSPVNFTRNRSPSRDRNYVHRRRDLSPTRQSRFFPQIKENGFDRPRNRQSEYRQRDTRVTHENSHSRPVEREDYRRAEFRYESTKRHYDSRFKDYRMNEARNISVINQENPIDRPLPLSSAEALAARRTSYDYSQRSPSPVVEYD